MRTRIVVIAGGAALLLIAIGAGWSLRNADDARVADRYTRPPTAASSVDASRDAQLNLPSAHAAGSMADKAILARIEAAPPMNDTIPVTPVGSEYSANAPTGRRTTNIESYFGDFIRDKLTALPGPNGCESMWQALARMETEPFDEQWAVPMELKLRSIWADHGPSPLDGALSIQCRKAVCQVSTLLDANAKGYEAHWSKFVGSLRSNAIGSEFSSQIYGVLSPPSDLRHKVVALVLKRADRPEDPDPPHCAR